VVGVEEGGERLVEVDGLAQLGRALARKLGYLVGGSNHQRWSEIFNLELARECLPTTCSSCLSGAIAEAAFWRMMQQGTGQTTTETIAKEDALQQTGSARIEAAGQG